MRIPKTIDDAYLSDLAAKIRILPPDEASVFLFEAGALVLLAGYTEIAYQLFTNLLTGELRIIEESSLAHLLKAILPTLCLVMKISCPAIFEQKEITISDFEQFILEDLEQSRQNEQEINDRITRFPLPSSGWSEDFLYEITHPTDITGKNRVKLYDFLRALDKSISILCFTRERLQEAARVLKILEEVDNVWEIDYKGYIHQKMLICCIHTYLELDDIENADKYILKWWQASDRFTGTLLLTSHFPILLKRILDGVLKDQLQISETQAQEFLNSVNTRNHKPDQNGFIPTVEDWKVLLKKWNHKIFENDEEYIEIYERYYSKVLDPKQCFKEGATEEQISELEKKLQVKIPSSYRNFLLASNGFIILNQLCELYGTEEINWLIEIDKSMAEYTPYEDDISDEEYFQYGEHQDCFSYREKYLKTALQISTTIDGFVYLLNPQIIDDRNEWEAWDVGSKYPGAYRYRSFWDMMQEIWVVR